MGWDDWPEIGPEPSVQAIIAGGGLTLGASSVLLHCTDFSKNYPGLKGTLWKNGAWASDLGIATPSGVLTLATSVPVATGDGIEIRIEYRGRISCPWNTRATLRRAFHFAVPAGSGTLSFDGSSMPVPRIDLAFGWTATDHLRLGTVVLDGDGATEDMTVTSKLLEVQDPEASTSSVDLEAQGVQVHESAFVRADLDPSCQVEFRLKSGASLPRTEDVFTLAFQDASGIPTYPTSFPTSGTNLQFVEVAGTHAARVQRP
jgi:hypothetical protein